MPPKLIIQSHREALMKEVLLDKPRITIGRKPGNDLQFNRPEISSSHAAFLSENDNYFVTDLGSTNGTLLNGARLVSGERYQLQDKDVITITPFSITFVMDKDMLDTYREQPLQEAQGRTGTEAEVRGKIRTGTEEHKVEESPLEETHSEGDEAPSASTPPAAEVPAPEIQPAPQAEPNVTPEAKPPEPPKPAPSPSGSPPPSAAVSSGARAGISLYVWLGIGAIFVLVAILLIAMLLVL